MSSLFAGFDIARSALAASQIATEVIGHNIANVNTEGYSRQKVTLATRAAYTDQASLIQAANQLGTGVDVSSVTRVRDRYLDQQLQRVTGKSSEQSSYSSLLERVQSALNEGDDTGISSALSEFFNAFQDLSQNPEQTDLRTVVLEQASSLAQQFQNLDGSLGGIKSDIASQVKEKVAEANDLAKQVADLNVRIKDSVTLGQHPNDLEDKRDQLIKQLSDLVGAQSHEEVDINGNSTGLMTVEVGGWAIVCGATANEIPSDYTSSATKPYLTDGIAAVFSPAGEVGGLIKASASIDDYRDSLNEVASTLIEQVNALHQTGYGLDNTTGRSFFSGTGASDIALSPDVLGNPDAIAAASPPVSGGMVAEGNGDIARGIAELADATVSGSSTMGDLYTSLVTRIGSDLKTAQTESDTLAAETEQVTTLINSTSGVSLDEELTNMMQYQRSYQAATRLISTIDSMLESLFSAVG